MSANNPVLLLHLSDIHFQRRSGDVYDEDRDLRNEILIDIGRMRGRIGLSTSAILVTGDIAFSGCEKEYKAAADWLKTVCEKSGCPEEGVWTTPGNHDVERKVVEDSSLLEFVRAGLRALSKREAEERLVRHLRDPQAGPLLFEPLRNYNAFAARFECAVDPKVPYWETDLRLNDGSTLRVRGLNSALLSDKHDDDGAHKLLLGSAARTLLRDDGVEYMTLCHHPPSWMIDADPTEDALNNRVRIQLFGHKHSQRIVEAKEYVRISAGAVHPDRREPEWEPRYNFFTVAVAQEDGRRRLQVHLYPRVFRNGEFQADFDKDGSDHRRISMALGEWTGTAGAGIIKDHAVRASAFFPSAPTPTEVATATRPGMTPLRRLTYRLLSLPYHLRLKAAQALSLIDDADRDISDVEQCKRILTRAKERNMLPQFWDEISKLHPDGPAADNPFAA